MIYYSVYPRTLLLFLRSQYCEQAPWSHGHSHVKPDFLSFAINTGPSFSPKGWGPVLISYNGIISKKTINPINSVQFNLSLCGRTSNQTSFLIGASGNRVTISLYAFRFLESIGEGATGLQSHAWKTSTRICVFLYLTGAHVTDPSYEAATTTSFLPRPPAPVLAALPTAYSQHREPIDLLHFHDHTLSSRTFQIFCKPTNAALP